MDNNMIGAQIAKFRKAAGITQEELGKAAGVSTQAVSRWECGGAPDVTLLPVIADRLGVTIDALFGREGGEAVDIHNTIKKWVRSLPEEQIFEQVNRLVWSGITAVPHIDTVLPFPESCYQITVGGKYEDVLNQSILQLDNGFYFGVAGSDFSFTTLCPRPENGYGAYLPEKDTIRSLFCLLAQPGCMETVEYMLRQSSRYLSAELLAQGTGMDLKTLTGLLAQMAENGLVDDLDVELLDGPAKLYKIPEDSSPAYLILLYLARCLQNRHHINYLNLNFREKPLL